MSDYPESYELGPEGEQPVVEPTTNPAEPGSYGEPALLQEEELVEEQQLVAEYEAYEQELAELAQDYPVDPTTPTPAVHDTPALAPKHDASDSSAPVNVTYDEHGDATQGVAPTSHVIGDPSADSSQWVFQGANGYCGPNSISMLVQAATGKDLTEQQVAQWAISNDEMTRLPAAEDPSGEPSLHYGMLPQQAVATLNALGSEYGFSAKLEQGNMGDLEGYLKGGREVMIEIDDEKIWHESGVPDSGQANHFVVVTGFDPSTNTVFINDPGSPDGKEESIPLSEFKSAWSASSDTMIVTSSTSGGSGGAAGGGLDDSDSDSDSVAAPSRPGPVFLPIVLDSEFVSSA